MALRDPLRSRVFSRAFASGAYACCAFSCAFAIVACNPSASSSSSGASSSAASSTAASQPPPAPKPVVTGPLIEWAAAPDGDVPAIVQREVERAKKDGRTLLVYVGALWCEPCQRFHKASEAGQVTGDLPPLRMLEFDLDRDNERLAAAGYGSRMIPLFAAPAADGRCSDARMEGSIKGEGAIANIVPRLQALLARAKGS